MIDKEQLKRIINDLREVSYDYSVERFANVVSFETIFKEACSYQRGLMAQRSRCREIPTEKQIEEIKRLNKGIVPVGITKKEAINFIGKLKNKKDGKKEIKV